jgi:hypothetical protein
VAKYVRARAVWRTAATEIALHSAQACISAARDSCAGSTSLPATAGLAEPSKLINMVDHVTQGTMVTW